MPFFIEEDALRMIPRTLFAFALITLRSASMMPFTRPVAAVLSLESAAREEAM